MARQTEQEITRQGEIAVDRLANIDNTDAMLAYLNGLPPLVLREVCGLMYIEHEGHAKPWLVANIARESGAAV